MALLMRIKNYTRALGEAQGYIPLYVRDETVIDSATGEPTNEMSVAFEPTPDELERLNKGEPIILSMFCVSPPPMRLTVGDDE